MLPARLTKTSIPTKPERKSTLEGSSGAATVVGDVVTLETKVTIGCSNVTSLGKKDLKTKIR